MKIDRILHSIRNNMPGDISTDLRRNLEAVLRNNLEKMNLVSREEFEVQKKILERTRLRVKELEEKIQQLEKRV